MRAQQGITLVDAVITLAVMALMIGWFIPSMQQWHAHHLLDTQMRDVQGLMQQAQMASLNHGRPWTLCGSRDGVHCDGRWKYLLVLDAGRHVRYRIQGNDQVSLHWKGLSEALVFHPRLSGSILNGTFYLCHAQQGRKLIVNRLGRMRFQSIDSEDCQTHP
ncbi:GspH/FimT family pseudopilin [Kushneria marisflavi]|uniref:Type II secretion system protein H n=1 Tax=Kushneria marisflavi TaxID=157779 RepID=A0A240UN70_9GAMM|nr:GspH/FimT family pseudopilin [Kushneria marisflavi]ART62523.1 hypothetical protein B9H00_05220 [Kushneria marisflavi]RKD84104.1 Tfp pilus assembly protein FimT [Kushneria marisflavi]